MHQAERSKMAPTRTHNGVNVALLRRVLVLDDYVHSRFRIQAFEFRGELREMLTIGQAGGCDYDDCKAKSFSGLIDASHAALFARACPSQRIDNKR